MKKMVDSIKNKKEKIKTMPAAVKAVFVYVIINFFNKGVTFITTPIFTRILSVEDYGVINIYSTWLSMIGVVATLSLCAGGFNIGLNEFKKSREGYIASLLVLSNAATGIVLLVYTCFHTQIDNIVQLPQSLIVLMFLYFWFNPAKEFWLASQRFDYKYKLASIVSLFSLTFATIVSIVVVSLTKDQKAVWRLWTMEGIVLIVSVILYVYILIKGIRFFSFSYWKFILPINLPLIIHILSKSLLDSSDKLMIGRMIGAGDVGKYSVVSMLSVIASIFWTSLNASFEPYTYQCMEKKEFYKINRISKSLMCIYLGICGGVILVGPEVVKLLAPAQYFDAIYVVPPLVAGIYFTALYNLFGNVELFYKKTKLIMLATLSATLFNILLNYFFIPLYSYIAAAYTTLICFVFLALFHYYNIVRITCRESIYDGKYLAFLSGIMISIVFISNYLYRNRYVRYFVIFVLLFLVLIYRKRLIKYFEKLWNLKDY